jgi:hypothetical protein
VTPSAILRAARDRVAREGGWGQGGRRKGDETYCAIEALVYRGKTEVPK